MRGSSTSAQGATEARKVDRREKMVPSIHDTAYPRLKASVTAHDLAEVYTPTLEEQRLAATLTSSVTGQVGFRLCRNFSLEQFAV
jgi:hypothetical protein